MEVVCCANNMGIWGIEEAAAEVATAEKMTFMAATMKGKLGGGKHRCNSAYGKRSCYVINMEISWCPNTEHRGANENGYYVLYKEIQL